MLVLLVLLTISEGISRIFFPESTLTPIFNDSKLRSRGRSFIEPHPNRGFSLKANFQNNLYQTNSLGFRNEEFPTKFEDQYYKILAIGESTTFGWQVNNNNTYPAQLMQLATKKQVQIEGKNLYFVNAGIPSYTSSQARVYLEEILLKGQLKPDMVLLNIMWNDIWYSSVKNWHPDILIYQKPPAVLTWLLEYSRLAHLIIMGMPSEEKLTDIENPRALQKYKENLQAMIALAQQYNIKLAFVEPPIDADHMPEQGLNEFQIRYHKPFFIEQAKKYRSTMQTVASDEKHPVLNHHLSLDNLHQKSLFLDLLHPTEEGNAIMARNIYTPLINYIRSNKNN